MSSQYSPRLYELLKSYQKNNRRWFFDVDDLKELLDCTNYARWPDFRRRVLEPAITEINQYSDLKVTMTTEKEGRKVTRITFVMTDKSPTDLFEAKRQGTEKMDGQMDFEALLAEIRNKDML